MGAIATILRALDPPCRDASRLVTERDFRRLGPAERLGLAIHLAGCGNCRRYAGNVRLLRAVLREADDQPDLIGVPEPLPDDARARIREAVDPTGP